MSRLRGRGRSGGRGRGRMMDTPIRVEMPYHSSHRIPPVEQVEQMEDDYIHSEERADGHYTEDEEHEDEEHEDEEHEDEEQVEEEEDNFNSSSRSTSGSKVPLTLTSTQVLKPERIVQRRLKAAIETKYREDVARWKKISQANRDLMFDYWKSFFRFDPTLEEEIRDAWEKKGSATFTEKMSYLRKTRNKPSWIPLSAWENIVKIWASKDYKDLCARNKRNRASSSNGPTLVNRGGAMSRSEREDKLRKDLGREPTVAEVFCSQYGGAVDDDGKVKFFQDKAQEMHTNFLRNLDEYCEEQGHGVDYVPPKKVQAEIWAKTHGISKKGTVCGLASDARLVRSSSRSRSSSDDAALRQKIEEMEQMQQKIQMQEEQLQTQAEQLQTQAGQLQAQTGQIQTQATQIETLMANQKQFERFMQMFSQPSQQPTTTNTDLSPTIWVPPNMSQPGTFPLYFSHGPPAAGQPRDL